MGILNVAAATPNPPSHVLGGIVQAFRVDGHSAAQNIIPSIPLVAPGPAGLGVTV